MAMCEILENISMFENCLRHKNHQHFSKIWNNVAIWKCLHLEEFDEKRRITSMKVSKSATEKSDVVIAVLKNWEKRRLPSENVLQKELKVATMPQNEL